MREECCEPRQLGHIIICTLYFNFNHVVFGRKRLNVVCATNCDVSYMLIQGKWLPGVCVALVLLHLSGLQKNFVFLYLFSQNNILKYELFLNDVCLHEQIEDEHLILKILVVFVHLVLTFLRLHLVYYLFDYNILPVSLNQKRLVVRMLGSQNRVLNAVLHPLCDERNNLRVNHWVCLNGELFDLFAFK